MNSRAKKVSGAVVCLLLVVTVFTVVSMTGALAETGYGMPTDVPDEGAMMQKALAGKISDSQISEILPGGKYIATIFYEDSSMSDINEMGFYYPCNNTDDTNTYSNGCCALYRLFNGSNGPGNSVTFDTRDDNSATSDDFGLWLNTPAPHQDWHRAIGGLYFSQRMLNVDNFQHALIYKVPLPSKVIYIVLWEDWCGGGDEDYGDMIVMLKQISPTPTPTAVPTVEVTH